MYKVEKASHTDVTHFVSGDVLRRRAVALVRVVLLLLSLIAVMKNLKSELLFHINAINGGVINLNFFCRDLNLSCDQDSNESFSNSDMSITDNYYATTSPSTPAQGTGTNPPGYSNPLTYRSPNAKRYLLDFTQFYC